MADGSANRKPKYNRINGINYMCAFNEDHVNSVVRYPVRPDDVIVSTVPKCGTHWIAQIVCLIKNDGKLPQDSFDRIVFMEKEGAEEVASRKRDVIFIHQMFDRTPYHPHAKYVVMVRNPFDTCVSYYHHVKMIRPYEFEGTFDDILDVFMDEDEFEFGGYFAHLDSWWPRRHDGNVYITSYEAMKADPRKEILKLAKFLDYRKHDKMLSDPTVLDNVVVGSSFDTMKRTVDEAIEAHVAKSTDEKFKKAFLAKKPQFIRKGQVGGWKEYFNEEQEQALRSKFLERAGDKVSLWGDLCTWI